MRGQPMTLRSWTRRAWAWLPVAVAGAAASACVRSDTAVQVAGGRAAIIATALMGTVLVILLAARHEGAPRASLGPWGVASLTLAWAGFAHLRLWSVIPFALALALLSVAAWKPAPVMRECRRLALGVVILGVGAQLVIAATATTRDVGAASSRGGAALVRGDSPYSDEAVRLGHGQTYGPLAYETYVPARLLLRERPAQRVMAALAYLLLGGVVALALRRVGGSAAVLPGLAAWVAFPAGQYCLAVSAHDDLVAAASLGAVVVAGPVLAGLLLGAAIAFKVVPIVLLPLVLRRHGSRAGRMLGALVLVGVLATVPVLVLGSSPGQIFDEVVRNQGERLGIHVWNVPVSEWWPLSDGLSLLYHQGFWWRDPYLLLHTVARIAFVVLALVLARQVAQRGDRERVLAAAITTMLLILLVLNNMSWNYVTWFAPLLAVGLFGRSTQEPRRPD